MAFVAQGRRLGRLLAERGHVLINGGGKFGGMGALNEGCRAAGGVIECVIHEMFVVDEGEFEGSDHLIVCQGDDLGERKRALVERCDVIIVLPGGLGTLDEMLDAAALSQLGMPNARPVVAVNIGGYYDSNQYKTISTPEGPKAIAEAIKHNVSGVLAQLLYAWI